MIATLTIFEQWPFNVIETSPGHFYKATDGPVIIQDCEKGRIFASILSSSHIESQLSHDMDNVLYGKLILNLNNAISALSGLTLKQEL